MVRMMSCGFTAHPLGEPGFSSGVTAFQAVRQQPLGRAANTPFKSRSRRALLLGSSLKPRRRPVHRADGSALLRESELLKIKGESQRADSAGLSHAWDFLLFESLSPNPALPCRCPHTHINVVCSRAPAS